MSQPAGLISSHFTICVTAVTRSGLLFFTGSTLSSLGAFSHTKNSPLSIAYNLMTMIDIKILERWN